MLTHITDYIAKNASNFPKKPAVIFEGTHYTWSELAHLVEDTAQAVAGRLPKNKQAVVGILLPNSVDFLRVYLGIIQAGHIAMPLDPNFKALEVQTVLDQMKPTFIVSNESYSSLFRSADTVVASSELQHSAQLESYIRFDPKKQVASMLFTSGTTGNPKAVPYTHANHMWNIPVVSDMWQWTSEDTLLLSLPLSHWHGLVMGVDGALYHGNTIYLQERFEPTATITALQSGDISLFMHVPIAYAKLVEYAQGAVIDIPQVRLCISGSSYLPPKLWQQFKELFGHEILERYGANEMGLLTSNTLDARIPGCVGKPLPGVTITLRKDGEIAMRSPGLFPGYWRNVEATTAQRSSNGLWLSGDIGEFDDDGRLHLKGRVQEKMKKQGYTVYPRDVEWALMQHAKVDEVAVLSLQHKDSLSDEFIYFVVGSITDKEIQEFAKQKMPSFWRPDRIVHVEAIPRTGRTSKPALKDLRAMIE